MSAVTIYMEGGGSGPEGKAALRQGMDSFLNRLKEAAAARSWRWNLVPCGGRGDAFNAFRQAAQENVEGIAVLLVDSEGPVPSDKPFREYLEENDRWDLSFASEDEIHLMIQIMETWIIADKKALANYCGEGFRKDELPNAQDMEGVSRSEVGRALEAAIGGSSRGRYHKIKHASDLLRQMNPDTVQDRCPACRRLFETLAEVIERP